MCISIIKLCITHCKFVLRCCEQCPRLDLPNPESDQHNSNIIPIIKFHVYQHIERFTVHCRRPFNEKKQFWDAIVTAKLYNRKYLAMMESLMVDFHQDFYILDIQKLSFCLPYFCILGTHHCGNTFREAFKFRSYFQYLLCRCYYSERDVDIISQKNQYE